MRSTLTLTCKKLVLLFLTLSANVQALDMDKQAHLSAGFAVAFFTSSLVKTHFNEKNRLTRAVLGIVAGFGAGLAKEYYDSMQGKQMDAADIGATVGGAVGASLFIITLDL